MISLPLDYPSWYCGVVHKCRKTMPLTDIKHRKQCQVDSHAHYIKQKDKKAVNTFFFFFFLKATVGNIMNMK